VGLWVPAAGAVVLVALPIAGLLLRAPWSDLGPALASPDVRQALLLSAECSFGALGVALVLGVPLAWVLARVRFPGRDLFRALVTLPMVLPPVVAGVALLFAFGRSGLVGRYAAWLPGFPAPFTTEAVVLAEAFVAMPFLVITTEAGLAPDGSAIRGGGCHAGRRPMAAVLDRDRSPSGAFPGGRRRAVLGSSAG